MQTPPDTSDHCPLCKSASCTAFHQDKHRAYLRCPACSLVFVPSKYYLSPQEEKAEYDLHQNQPYDPGYRRFLSRLFDPMQQRIAPGSHGLDFGCGPGPALSLMFQEAGYSMSVYDPFYAPEPSALETPVDFITATEVVEHLHRPAEELDRLWGLLKPGGTLGIMTKLVIDRDAFSRWHYKNDLTHVCFFSRETFEWVGVRWEAEVVFADKDVILLGKKFKSNL